MGKSHEIDFFKLNYSKDTIRFWSITYMLFYVGFGVVDYYSAPISFKDFWSIRLMVLPFFLAAILSTYFGFLARYRLLFSSSMVFVTPFSITLMITLAEPAEYAKSIYFAGIVLSAFPIGLITMNVKHTLKISFLTLLFYFALLGWDTGVSEKDFGITTGFVVASMVATTLSAYLLESNQIKIIKQTHQLDSLVRLKNNFISILAHDLRAPCGSILGFADFYLTTTDKLKKSETLMIMDGIKKSASGLLNLLQNLLEWSKVQNSNHETNPTMVKVDHLVSGNVELLKGMIDLKEIKVDFDLHDFNRFVYADCDMINTVIRNLLSNAIKFTPKGGTIRIDCKAGGEQVFMSIADSGIGIPEQKLKTIFQIVKNKSTKGTNNEAGSGLGLLLCRELIKKNNGDIWAESKPGQGSKFSISLPLYF